MTDYIPNYTCFDSSNHPEMLSVVLKGDYLKEFLALANEQTKLLEAIHFIHEAGSRKQNRMKQLDFLHEVIYNVTKGLKSENASKYGLCANDLKLLLNATAGIDFDALENEENPYLSNENREQDPRHENLKNCTENLMWYFSACVAAQEKKERLLVDISTDTDSFKAIHATIKSNVSKRIRAGEKADHDDQMRTSLDFIKVMLNKNTLYEIHAKRNSPIAKMEQEILFGAPPARTGGQMGEVRKILATIYNCDTSSHAGLIEMRKLEEKLWFAASALTGLKRPAKPEVG